MESASRHLTPVSLELGGKSPVIIDRSADIDLAAKRIVFGKFINAGQTCVAPDYVLVTSAQQKLLLERLHHWIDVFYPREQDGHIADYPRIVNEKHFDRLVGLMKGEEITKGGDNDRASLTIYPTVLENVKWNSPVMQEEIFGPILPVITYDNFKDALERIRLRPKPLALYLFTRDNAIRRHVLRNISFGGGCVNDVLLHVASSYLPFGGVGNSGMGSYHGKASFETFTHFKSIVDKGGLMDPSVRYRPYTEMKKKLLRWLA